MRAGVSSARSSRCRPVERGGAPEPVDLAHRLRDLDLGLHRDLLADQLHWEDRRQVVRSGRLHRARVERWQRLAWKVGQEVDPVRRDAVLGKRELRLCGHGAILAGQLASPADGEGRANAVARRSPRDHHLPGGPFTQQALDDGRRSEGRGRIASTPAAGSSGTARSPGRSRTPTRDARPARAHRHGPGAARPHRALSFHRHGAAARGRLL
jgi:hypothetical protein